MLKKGDYVKVFQKPLTQEDYEGIGKVRRVVKAFDGKEAIVEVSFRDDRGPFTRIIGDPIQIVPEEVVPSGIQGYFGGF